MIEKIINRAAYLWRRWIVRPIKKIVNRAGNLYRRWIVKPIKALKDKFWKW